MSVKEEEQRDSFDDDFPAGLKVLLVDDDPLCLKVIGQMLKCCKYEVTTCANGKDAIQTLRDRQSHCDLVLSDVYMPDMDGFKLLETIGLELDIPVIMMSSNGETGVVLRGVTHGAVDFLIKPVRVEELRNVWQHVVRKRKDLVRESSQASDDDGDERRPDRKRKDRRDSDEATAKKPRVVWTVEMHQQFVNAVNQLGIDKAVPKRILDLLNVEGLTRENVASHLQKYRLYLKRLSGVNPGGKGKGGRMAGMDSNFAMLHAHAAMPLGVPGNYPNMPGAVPGLMGLSMGYETNNPHLALQMQQMGIHPSHMGLTLPAGMEASPSFTSQLSMQPPHHPQATPGMSPSGLQHHPQVPEAPFGMAPGGVPIPGPAQLGSHGYGLLAPQSSVPTGMHDSRPASAVPEPVDDRLRSSQHALHDQQPVAVHPPFASGLDGLMGPDQPQAGVNDDPAGLRMESGLGLPRVGSWLPSADSPSGLPMDASQSFKPFGSNELQQDPTAQMDGNREKSINEWDIFSHDMMRDGDSTPAPSSSSPSPHSRAAPEQMDDLLHYFLKPTDPAANSSC
ncbi:hypothetical protein WJX84_006685 [Apatococcus fuscideae]|uniref:Two-component response regulator n=1 Tax=Apatococcus fuscideae TaxID=2026836 RepID=A0AAW1SR86_9CHLO